MFKKIMAALSAFILAGCLYAESEDLVIDGLGNCVSGKTCRLPMEGAAARKPYLRNRDTGKITGKQIGRQ